MSNYHRRAVKRSKDGQRQCVVGIDHNDAVTDILCTKLTFNGGNIL